jgi:CheY-like chemotaxis protein
VLEAKDITILIVDDDLALRNAMVFDFKRKGFHVLDAENGEIAFEVIKNNKVDLVLTDVRMPNGDGVELLENIKTLSPQLPVVMFITGFSDISLEDAYDKGVDAVFAKPFDRKELHAAVMKAVTDKNEQWAIQNINNGNSDFNIELEFPEFKFAAKGQVLNIGRGGMFIGLKESFPQEESKTSFRLQFQQGSLQSIVGTGIVRWIRVLDQDGLPSGCGIEFDYLEEASRNQVIALIETLTTKAFIPKT